MTLKKVLTANGTALLLFLSACGGSGQSESGIRNVQPEDVAVFTSTDSDLQKSYEWARKTALSYSHGDDSPVGYWYEAALPHREAFCMRDVSHQSVGAQILGLSLHNANMFSKFVTNISESKDWCSFWEINRYDKPAPADYVSDKEFWYNLNANFDIMQACYKMYEWTGDTLYISGVFSKFYDHTFSDYIPRWDLTPEKIMTRGAYMNTSGDFDPSNNLHSCRGLPSYVENMPGLTVGIDLLASIYAGLGAYSGICLLREDYDRSAEALSMAMRYREIIEREWWDKSENRFQTARLSDGSFSRGEGITYLLWHDVLQDSIHIARSFEELKCSKWNAENISHFPTMFYRYGYCNDAYTYLLSLPKISRADYPEVSFGFIEGCICGAMGFIPSYERKTVETMSRLKGEKTESDVRNVKVFDGYMSLRHIGNAYTFIENNTSETLVWKAAFMGEYESVEAEGHQYPVEKKTDFNGNIYCVANIELKPGSSIGAKAV